MKIKVHPLFFASVPLYILFGGVKGYLLAFFAVTLHECAHCFVASVAGAKDTCVLLMPYGATLLVKGEFSHFGAVLIAGPFANLVLASFSLSACWLFPELYGYLKDFIFLNAVLAALNLLPAYPLDGGRIFRLLFPAKWARAATLIFTLLLSLSAGAFFAFTRGISYLIFSLFLLLSFASVIAGRRNRVKESDPLYRLARTDEEGRLRPASVKKGKRRVRLSANDVAALLLSHPSTTPIAQALAERYK